MKIFYTDTFPIPLPENHRFPKDKYALLRKQIMHLLNGRDVELRIPDPATREDMLRAHDASYLERFLRGELTARETRRVGLPWSPEIVKRTRYSTGATIAACRFGLSEGVAMNLGGGTHHAFSDHGQGYCWINDVVIAARTIQAQGLAKQILIVDCDVHQGNGTAAIVKTDPTIFSFSIHGRKNFPFHKEKSDMDLALPDNTDDGAYLEALDKGLDAVMQAFTADMVVYLAGADPFETDRFGRLSLTKEGLAERDRLVFEHCRQAGLPVAVTLAGGYAPLITDIVDINFQTIVAALAFQRCVA
jgi:acetoin utilization deacetylase AcuC-like enzyme